jgi:hypothetical protein
VSGEHATGLSERLAPPGYVSDDEIRGGQVTDPRWKRAAQVRELVLLVLGDIGPLPFSDVLARVRRRSIAPVRDRDVDRALQALRRAHRVRYQRPFWERVPTMEHRP